MKGAPLLVGTAAAVILAVCAWALSGTPPRPTLLPPRVTTTTTSSTVAPTPPAPPSEPPPTQPAPPSGPATYVVQPGDTLGSIAAAHGLAWQALCAANHLADCNLIYVGQRLTLTGTTASQPSTTPQVSRPTVAEAPGTPTAPAVTAVPAGPGPGYGCAAAVAYLAAHAAPGFTFSCPTSAGGHYGETCWNHPPQCGAGTKVIYISCPVPTVYRNEAENSWLLTTGKGTYDAFGQGTPAEQAYCNGRR